MSDKRGRTMWDFLAEPNDVGCVVIIALVIVGVVIVKVFA